METNLLQLFAHPEISELFSIISDSIFGVNIVVEREQAYLVTIYLFCINLHCPQLLYCFPLPYRCSGVPVYTYVK